MTEFGLCLTLTLPVHTEVEEGRMFDFNDRIQWLAHSLEDTYVQGWGEEEGFFWVGPGGMGTLFLTLHEGAETAYGFWWGGDKAPGLCCAPHPLYRGAGWVEVRDPSYRDEEALWRAVWASYRWAKAHPQSTQPTDFAPVQANRIPNGIHWGLAGAAQSGTQWRR